MISFVSRPINQLLLNCNYSLLAKLTWSGDNEGAVRSFSRAATCPPVYNTRQRFHAASSYC